MEMRAAMTLMALAVTAGAGGCGTLSGLEDYDRVDASRPGEGTTTSGAGVGGAGGGMTSTSSSGGMGGQGGAGGGAPQVTNEWFADNEVNPVTGTLALPDWLVLESPSDNKTVQIDADRLLTGFGPNAPRARSLDGSTWGLAVESERTNRLHHARIFLGDPGWALSNGTLMATDGPAGDALAAHVEDVFDNQSSAVYEDFEPAQNQTVTISAWAATGDSQATLECNNCSGSKEVLIPPTLAWHRESLTTIEGQTGTSLVRVRPAAPEHVYVGIASFDFVSIETGKYPTSTIITTGAPATREAEKLYVPSASNIAPGGYFSVVMTFTPYYAPGEQAGDHDLLYFDGMNRLYVRASDNAIVLQAGGMAVLETPMLTWAREQVLTVELTSTESGRTLRVARAGEDDVEDSDPGSSPFPVNGPLYILGSNTGAQECADLRSIRFKPPM